MSEEDILKVESLGPIKSGDKENEDLIENGVLGLQAIREQLMEVLLDADQLKWSSVTWPSSLAETFR